MESKPGITYESDDFREDGGAGLTAAIGNRPNATWAIILDETLPPWGCRVEGINLYLGLEAKRHNTQYCKHTSGNPAWN